MDLYVAVHLLRTLWRTKVKGDLPVPAGRRRLRGSTNLGAMLTAGWLAFQLPQ